LCVLAGAVGAEVTDGAATGDTQGDGADDGTVAVVFRQSEGLDDIVGSGHGPTVRATRFAAIGPASHSISCPGTVLCRPSPPQGGSSAGLGALARPHQPSLIG